jgi:membrane protease YdiL (CAAX protease family)
MDGTTENGSSQTDLPYRQPPAESVVDSIFIGPSGLRAGWRLAIYVAAFYFLTYTISFAIAPLLAQLPDNGMQQSYLLLIGDTVEFIAAIVPAFVMSRLEQRPFGAYGLAPIQAFRKNFWIGAIWGILSLTLLLVLMRTIHVFYFGGFAVHGARAVKFAGFWGLVFLVVALYEEFISRGYTQFTLAEGIGFWPAALLISALFGISHLANPGENWTGAVGAGIIGLFWCFTLRRTGSLWFGIGMHASWDWAESFLYSVPDSGLLAPGHLLKSSFHGPTCLTGGPVGPEGSLLLIVLFAGLWFLFDRLYPEVKYGRRETIAR